MSALPPKAEIGRRLSKSIIVSRLNHDFHRYNLRGDGASEPEATSSWNDWAYFTIGSVPSSCHRHPIDLPQTTASASTYSSCQSSKFIFVINLGTAKALGLTIPSALLARADELIE
jgi:hypothetical protein